MIVGSAVLVLADSVDRQNSAMTSIATVGFVLAIGVALVRLPVLWWRKRSS